jgi:glycosyltransferase involved in cell wall biosynthesis
MKGVLFIANHRPNRSPSQRFRFEQYLQYLAKNNVAYELSYLITKVDDQNLYSKGKYLKKILILVKSYLIRIKNVISVFNGKYSVVFIHREALLNGSYLFEWLFSKSKAKLIFDFDDAIWLPNVSEENKKLEWIKNYKKTSRIISLANEVIAGNKYLKNYALQFNKNVTIIPTTIDTNYHVPCKQTKESICIGWTGTSTTIKHFELIIPVLKKLKEIYGSKIYFKLIGDANFKTSEIEIETSPWKLETEIYDLQEIDIGIMPLPDDEWSKGKCGFKGLQYMALEIPAIMSPVGVNEEIINDGVNGFLASNEDDWIQKLSMLIDSSELREQIGKNGRITIVERFSVESQKNNYLNIIS